MVAECGPEALDVVGLQLEVELTAQRVGEMLDHGGDVDDLAEHFPVRGLLGEELEETEVAVDVLPCGGSLDLHDDAFAVLQDRAVHLPDCPGCERLGLDAREDVLPRNAELLLHHLDDLGLGQRRDLVLEARELGDGLGREQVGASREDLAELRECGTKLLEGLAEAACTLLRRIGVAACLRETVLAEDGRDPRCPAEEPFVCCCAHSPAF